MKGYHGVVIPLFSIRTKNSLGIGTYLDLIPFIDLFKRLRFNCIQLLPIHDTGLDSSPYAALSGNSFHPIYISIDPKSILEDERKFFEEQEKHPNLDYQAILHAKLKILKRVYLQADDKTLEEIEAFLEVYPYLKSYAVFKWLKEEKIECLSEKNLSSALIDELFSKHKKQLLFHIFLQKICHDQLLLVANHADRLQVKLICDMPILVSLDSVEVYEHPEFFDKTLVAGAPPDSFNKEGQYWGFPTYQWLKIIQSNFLIWKEKFQILEKFFSYYRIDHILGFFRFFSIEKGKTAAHGRYIPQDEKEALNQGKTLLAHLISMTKMKAIGEDLGTKFLGLDQVLQELKITQTKIIIWEKKGHHFIPFKNYPYNSIVSLSNHDIPLFLSWWKKHPHEQSGILELLKLPKPYCYDASFQLAILKRMHQIDALFKVNLIQEFLAVSEKYFPLDPDSVRINIPGIVNKTNWTYRMPCTLEELSCDYDWMSKILSLVDA
jgi:4-alpha-glucanotransferase